MVLYLNSNYERFQIVYNFISSNRSSDKIVYHIMKTQNVYCVHSICTQMCSVLYLCVLKIHLRVKLLNITRDFASNAVNTAEMSHIKLQTFLLRLRQSHMSNIFPYCIYTYIPTRGKMSTSHNRYLKFQYTLECV